MYKFSLLYLLLILALFAGCRDNSRALEQDASEAAIASETGQTDSSQAIPADAIALTKALINGVLYEEPSFNAKAITRFDTSQQLFLLDTTDILFVKTRLLKDSTVYTGYVSKAILPEKN